MITDRVGRHEALLPIYQKYYTFRGSQKGQKAGENSENSLFYDFVENLVFETQLSICIYVSFILTWYIIQLQDPATINYVIKVSIKISIHLTSKYNNQNQKTALHECRCV